MLQARERHALDRPGQISARDAAIVVPKQAETPVKKRPRHMRSFNGPAWASMSIWSSACATRLLHLRTNLVHGIVDAGPLVVAPLPPLLLFTSICAGLPRPSAPDSLPQRHKKGI